MRPELILPLTTPLDRKGNVDRAALIDNVAAYAGLGVDGFVLAGSTGEAAALTDDERVELVSAVRGVVPSDARLVAGTGRESTRATVALSRRAAQAGADELLVLTPYYFRARMTAQAIASHYRAVADACAAPLILYSMPAVTGLTIPASVVGELSREPRIVGLKDSSGDVSALEASLGAAEPGFRVYCGHGGAFAASVAAGASGGVLAAACIVPEVYIAMRDHLAAGRDRDAASLQRSVSPFVESVVVEHGVAGVKAAIELRGLSGGDPRPPLMPVDEPTRNAIGRELAGLVASGLVASVEIGR